MKHYQYKGGCHCKDVRYVIKLEHPVDSFDITACNCSICEKTGYLHLFVNKEEMKLLTPWGKLQKYQFNKKIAEHYFCKKCGIKSFYQPRSHPDKWSINLRCLDEFIHLNIDITHFDGKNWQANRHKIK